MYEASVGLFVPYLRNLSGLLDKGWIGQNHSRAQLRDHRTHHGQRPCHHRQMEPEFAGPAAGEKQHGR